MGSGKNKYELTAAEQKIIDELVNRKLLTKGYFSPKALKGLGSLTLTQVKALHEVNQKVSLNAFINAKGPQV